MSVAGKHPERANSVVLPVGVVLVQERQLSAASVLLACTLMVGRKENVSTAIASAQELSVTRLSAASEWP